MIGTASAFLVVLAAAPDLCELRQREPLGLGHQEEHGDAAGVRYEAVAHKHGVHAVLGLQRGERLEGGEGGEIPEMEETKEHMYRGVQLDFTPVIEVFYILF